MQTHNGKGLKNNKLNTDAIMVELWQHLCRDFRTLTSYDCFREEQSMLESSIKDFRVYEFKRGFLSPPVYFKCRYQLESLFKRYRFQDDLYNDEELAARTFNKFLRVQETREFPSQLKTRTFEVLKEARRICSDVLGRYSEEEHFGFCRFGKRATVGNKYKESYLELKVKALTCSQEQRIWFKHYLEGDALLQEAIAQAQGCEAPAIAMVDVHALDYTLVPKSFKSLRGIMPNTAIGGFYSYGLGRCIRERLKDVHLNVKRLQAKHGRYAKKFSRTMTHATADLSSASDCFTSALVNRLLPREWYNLVRKGRIGQFGYQGKTFHLSSFMTMGIGFTFELQTLLFYSLLKSIANLSKTAGTISVYGDDLIYPVSMHRFVVGIFQDIGFTLNEDKTYVKESFRESCGSDYYCGFDVRPYQPEMEGGLLSGVHAAVFLYKLANGLMRRWSESQIASTLYFLKRKIEGLGYPVFYVPPHYPDTSGWRTMDPPGYYFDSKARWYLNSNWTVAFPYITLSKKHRRVQQQCIYYWNSLRPNKDDWSPYDCIDDVTALIWKTPKGVPLIKTRSGVKVRKLVPFVTKKGVLPSHRVTEGIF